MISKVVNETAQGSVVNSTDRVGKNTLGKDDFMKLLMIQLGNQDPTSPADSKAFIAQLAQFSSLEQMQRTNDTLSSLVLEQSTAAQTNMATLVGKDITFKTDHVSLTKDGASPMIADLAGDAGAVTAVVVDGKGTPVRTVQLGAHSAGNLAYTWDGRKDDGSHAPVGGYQVRITAASPKGESVAVDLRGKGSVSGVSYTGDTPELVVSGMFRVKMSEILEISQPSSNKGSNP